MEGTRKKNPEWEGMPLGLGMRLAQDTQASERFWDMSESERAELISYVQGGTTGDEAQERIVEAVNRLRDGTFH